MKTSTLHGLAIAGGTTLALLAAIVIGAKLAARSLGIEDPAFRHENELAMWRDEPRIGYANAKHFSGFSYGNIPVETNERGFRGTRPTPVEKPAGVRRIVGLGDSILWGTGVVEADSILGLLEAKLDADAPHEVWNGGVIGYSTLQEMRFLEWHVLPLKPDVVLVNYCMNDTLPNEDPFDNARPIALEYLNGLSAGGFEASARERQHIAELAGIIANADHVWNTLRGLEQRKPGLTRTTRKVMVELPMARMADVARSAGVRLVYLFIPPKFGREKYAQHVADLTPILEARGAEWVDLQGALAVGENEVAEDEKWGEQRRSRAEWLQGVWPPELVQLLWVRRLAAVHDEYLFFDYLHPTKRGNEIIADEVYRYLAATDPRSRG